MATAPSNASVETCHTLKELRGNMLDNVELSSSDSSRWVLVCESLYEFEEGNVGDLLVVRVLIDKPTLTFGVQTRRTRVLSCNITSDKAWHCQAQKLPEIERLSDE